MRIIKKFNTVTPLSIIIVLTHWFSWCPISKASENNKIKDYHQDNIKFNLIPLNINEKLNSKLPYRPMQIDATINIYLHLWEKQKNMPITPWAYNLFTWSHGFFEHAGVSLIDLNQDGWLDIFATVNGEPRVYINLKNNRFSSPYTLAKELRYVNSGIWADYDNDGDLDVYLTRYAKIHIASNTLSPLPNLLLRNNGDLTFTDVTREKNLERSTFTQGAAWADYDNDGDLDLYVSNFGQNNHPFTQDDKDHVYQNDQLYKNEKGSYFTNVFRFKHLKYPQQKNKLQNLGQEFSENNKTITRLKSASLQPTWFDCNQDGKQDLFIPNRFKPSILYLNQGNEHFEKKKMNQSSHGNSTIIDDFNHDGYFDILEITLTNYKIYINDGKCNFHHTANLTERNVPNYSWSGISLDSFNDGFKDLYFIGGFPLNQYFLYTNYLMSNQQLTTSTFFNLAMNAANQNIFLKNIKGEYYKDKTEGYSLIDLNSSRGIAKGDLNNDGKIDFVLNNLNQGVIVYLNQAKTNNNALNIKLISTKKNIYNIGAQISILANNKWQYDSIKAGESLLSQNSQLIHFGVGKAKKIDKIKIKWANGKVSLLKNIPVNNTLIVYQD